VDELTFVSAEISTFQDNLTIESARLSQLLMYAGLQNLSGGAWHWTP
jgi:hypothetical protein